MTWIAQVPLPQWTEPGPAAQNSAAIVVMGGGLVDLGTIIADYPAKAQVFLFNPGSVARKVLGGSPLGVAPVYLDIPAEGLDIPPGEVRSLTIQVDPKLLARDGDAKVTIKNDLKTYPNLELRITALVEKPAVVCVPFPGSIIGNYDAVAGSLATLTPLSVVFSADTALAGRVEKWWIEDPQAPLVVEETFSSIGGANHTWEGRISLKPKVDGGPKLEGMTRVFVTTANGKTGFSTILWKITKK